MGKVKRTGLNSVSETLSVERCAIASVVCWGVPGPASTEFSRTSYVPAVLYELLRIQNSTVVRRPPFGAVKTWARRGAGGSGRGGLPSRGQEGTFPPECGTHVAPAKKAGERVRGSGRFRMTSILVRAV